MRRAPGFTLIEVLMAILIIAILAATAVSQFTNLSRDTRNATIKQNLANLRSAIQRHYGMMRLRCGVTGNAYPPLVALNANDITNVTGGVCTTTQVPETADRYFVSGGVPENPWSASTCTSAQKRTVFTSATNNNMAVGSNLVAGDLNSTTANCGWIYDVNTGRIKSNSVSLNGGDANSLGESAY